MAAKRRSRKSKPQRYTRAKRKPLSSKTARKRKAKRAVKTRKVAKNSKRRVAARSQGKTKRPAKRLERPAALTAASESEGDASPSTEQGSVESVSDSDSANNVEAIPRA